VYVSVNASIEGGLGDRLNDAGRMLGVYTVLRLTTPSGSTPELAQLIEKVNTASSPTRVEPRHKGDGHVAVLCDQQSWREHSAAALAFFAEHHDALRSARGSGAALTVDVAVEPEDRPNAPWSELMLSEDLLAELAGVGATFVVTIYAGET
jgi:hypothetical protein